MAPAWGIKAQRQRTRHPETGDISMTNDRSDLVPEQKAVTGGFSPSVDFISSVIAGLLLGLVLDWWLGTNPVFTIILIVGGFVAGFYKLWQHSAVLEELAQERNHGR